MTFDSSQIAPTNIRKDGKNNIGTVIFHFLGSESNICSLLHFGCFGSEITNSLSLFLNISCYFLVTFSNYGFMILSREILNSFQALYLL